MYRLSERAKTHGLLAKSDLNCKLKALKKEHYYSLRNIEENKKYTLSKYMIPLIEDYDSEEDYDLDLFSNEKRSQRLARKTSVERINALLMTEGEVDIEKVLCLHVAALSIPSLCPTRYRPEKDVLELTRYAKFLPNYLAVNSQTHRSCECSGHYCSAKLVQESPVQTFVMMNTEIEIILNMVVATLREINDHKLKTLIKLGRNPNSVKSILSSDKIVNFISQVYDSFKNTKSSVFRTEICTVIKGSTSLIKEIDKHWKNPVFKIILPESFPIYFTNMSSFSSELTGESYLQIPESLNKPGDTSSISRFSQSAPSTLHNESSDISIHNLKLPTNPSTIELTKILSSLLPYTGETSDKQSEGHGWNVDSSHNILETLFNFSTKATAPLAKYKSTINTENELDMIIESSKRNESLDILTIKRNAKLNHPESGIDKMKLNILNRVSNQQRILIADEVSHRKRKDVNVNGNLDSTVSIGSAMGSVMTKSELIQLASTSPRNEREFLLKSESKGGLGIGSFIIGSDNFKKLEQQKSLNNLNTSTELNEIQNIDGNLFNAESTFDISNSSYLDLAHMKQTIASYEIDTKVSKFLKSAKDFTSKNSLF